jgi:cytochrome c peroxidase
MLPVYDEQLTRKLARASELAPRYLSNRDLDALLDFLHALTDPAMLDMRNDVPKELPSGLPLSD